MNNDITQLRADFQRDGCLILRNFASEQELQEIESHLAFVWDKLNYERSSSKHSKFAGVIKNMNAVDPWFANQLISGRQASLIRDLLEDDLEPATAAFFERIPGEKAGINPHYDAVGHRRMGATIWIALDQADQQNGCLFYAKGSHTQVFESGLDLQGFDRDTTGAIPIEIKRGDAAIHSSRTVHWSYANNSDRNRRAVSYFYWAANSKPDMKTLSKWKLDAMQRKKATKLKAEVQS